MYRQLNDTWDLQDKGAEICATGVSFSPVKGVQGDRLDLKFNFYMLGKINPLLRMLGLFLAVFDVRGKDGCKTRWCSDTDVLIVPSTGDWNVMGKDIRKPFVHLLLQGFVSST